MSRTEVAMIEQLHDQLDKASSRIADLERQNAELREAIVALMEPGMPRVLLAPSGIMVMDQKWLAQKP